MCILYLQKVQNVISGYVRVTIEGFYIEKVINACKKNNIKLIDTKRIKSTLVDTSVHVSQFKDVAKIVKKSKCRIKIRKKRGIPFLLYKYKKRKIFVISMMMIIICLFALSKFIWNIEVVGNVNIATEDILNIAKNDGLELGKLKSKINPNELVQKIRMERPDVSWVGVKICGTSVRIEVVEADLAPKVINQDEFCNIVASKDAMITKISAQNGTLKVKEGDVVKEGTVLVAGWLEGKYTGNRYVHATGEVTGKVWYSETMKKYYKEQVKVKTGNEEKKYSININNFVINLYKRLSKFQIYDTIRTDKKLKISSNFYLPFGIVESTNYEMVEVEKNYTKDEAVEIAKKELKDRLDKKIDNKEDIVNEYIYTNENEEYVEVEVVYEVLENIGTEEKIAL